MTWKPLPYNADFYLLIECLYTFCQGNMRLLIFQLDLESSLDCKYFRNCLHTMGIFPGVKY